MPLSLEALAGGSSGWCCGCVQVQQQEQSCWVRFNLPEALKQDSSIVEAANKGLLVRGDKQLRQLGCVSRVDNKCCGSFLLWLRSGSLWSDNL
jgi:hypothetical protein